MKHIFNILILVVAIFTMTACSNEKQPNGTNWGTTEWYKDRFYYSYDPIVMTKTLEFTLNDDVLKYLDCENGFFELAISSTPDSYESPTNVKIYCNDVLTEDGKFKVVLGEDKSNVFTVDIGIEFIDSASEGMHQYYIVSTNNMNGNDTISDGLFEIPTSKDQINIDLSTLSSEGFYVEKIDVVNPADKILSILGIIIAICLALWFIILRYYFYPRIKVTRLDFTGPDSFNRTPRVKGCILVVLTANRKQKQGIWSRIFKGKILYIYDDVWTEEISFKYRKKSSVRISCNGDWSCEANVLDRHNTYTIEHITSRKRGKISVN